MSDLELRKNRTKVGKQGVGSLYLFEINKTKAQLRRYKKVLRDVGKRKHSIKLRRERLMSQRGAGSIDSD